MSTVNKGPLDKKMKNINNYDFKLPESLIAERPLEKRSFSRLLVFEKKTKEIKHDTFSNIEKYINPGDALIINNTKVLPAKITAIKENTEGKLELIPFKKITSNIWSSMVFPGKRIKIGTKIKLKEHFFGKILCKSSKKNNFFNVYFNVNIMKYIKKYGEVAIPPYIKRPSSELDSLRYQTIFARKEKEGAIAAPTASLHFDKEVINKIAKKKIKIIFITLHVGPGTFLPIRESDINKHKMYSEYYEISEKSAKRLNETRSNGKRIIAVGTTSLRAIESAIRTNNEQLKKHKGETTLFIKPEFEFKIADALITNFHLPKSTLLVLLSAAIGNENVKRIYNEAIMKKYRFYSYGDSCFLEFSKAPTNR